jgi:hypothetical protein
VPDLANLGFPIAEIAENGDVILTKLAEAGGMVTPETVKEQIVYEIHDPCNYLTPDVIADFSQVMVKEVAPNMVQVSGAGGKVRSGYYKTSIGYQDGFLVEGEISYGGSGAYQRAHLARDIVEQRLAMLRVPVQELRFDYSQCAVPRCAFPGDYPTLARCPRSSPPRRSTNGHTCRCGTHEQRGGNTVYQWSCWWSESACD